MNESNYIILSDDAVESRYRFDISKEDEKKINAIIEKAISQNKK